MQHARQTKQNGAAWPLRFHEANSKLRGKTHREVRDPTHHVDCSKDYWAIGLVLRLHRYCQSEGL